MNEAALPKPKTRKLVSGNAALLARRYAGAFYGLAESEKNLDGAAADLRSLLQLAEDDQNFIILANHPRLTRAQLVKAAGTVAKTLKLGKLTAKFLALVAQHRRLPIL